MARKIRLSAGQEGVQRRHHLCAFADRRSHALDRFRTHVADGEDSTTGRFQRMAAYVPRWGMQLTANWSESEAWATYRLIQKQYASLIGDREPIVVRSRGLGPGTESTLRYNIRIADDDRA